MKKLVLTLSVLTIAACSYAQGISGGIKGGLNLANLSGDVEDTDMKIGFHGGAYLNIAFTENFSLQPELLYNAAGAKGTENDGYDDYDYTYKFNYVSVPVMLIYSFGKVNIQAGPQIGILTGAKVKIESGGQSAEIDYKDFLKSTDFGVNVGVGANFGKLNAAARYTIGLSNIADTEGDGDDFEVKTSVIQISLGYRLFGG